MTDYAEEQRNEIEALQSIYPEEIEVIEEEPQRIFTVTVSSQDPEDPHLHVNKDGTPDKVGCTVQFTYTAKYPDEAPIMEIIDVDRLEEDQTEIILEFLKEQAQENLGMVMVFTIISALQEKLTVLVEDMKKNAEQKRLQIEKEEEEAEMTKFEGTRVTIETFLAWKGKFDAEILERKCLALDRDLLNKKPTGRELFMHDASMNDSDITFLQEEGDNVEVDESLFEDMEDLDLEEVDDEEDDPDYVP